MQLYVVVASAGRAEVCSELADWSQNLVTPDSASVTWLLSTPTEADTPPSLPPGWVALTGARGAAAQRNRALDAVPTEADYVFFFDDDTVPRQDFFAAVVAGFEAHTAWVAITANLARDGAAEKVEIGLAEASSELAASEYRGDTELRKSASCTAAPSPCAGLRCHYSGSRSASRCTPGWRISTTPGRRCCAAKW